MATRQFIQTCARCGNEFLGWRKSQRFCSHSCALTGLPPETRLKQGIDDRGPTECSLWTEGVNCHGYGVFQFRGKKQYAHRAAWTLANGPIPAGMFVLHRCDTPRCCNARHLFLGDQSENMSDMVSKGRQLKGEQKPNAKLTPTDVLAIRASSEPYLVIAERHKTTPSNVGLIRRRVNWKHLA